MSRRNIPLRNGGNPGTRFQFDILQQFFSCFRDPNTEHDEDEKEYGGDNSRLSRNLRTNHGHGHGGGRGMKQSQNRRNHRRVLINRSMIGYPTDFRHTAHMGSHDVPFNLSSMEENALRLQFNMRNIA